MKNIGNSTLLETVPGNPALPIPSGRNKRWLLLILVFAVAIRVLLLSVAWRQDHAALAPDSHGYLAPAQSLANEHEFRYLGKPEIFRTPGYPLFLVLCGSTGSLGYTTAQAVQVALDALMVYLVYLLGARLFGYTAGLWAAMLHACSLVAMIGAVQILTDGLFSFLLTVAIVLLVEHVRRGGFRSLFTACVLTAAATYVRPVGFVFVPLVVIVLLFRPRRLLNAILFSSLFAALVVPWVLRNYLETGYLGFSVVGQYNLLFYEAAGVWAQSHNVSIVIAQHQLDNIFRQRLAARGIGDPGSPAGIDLAGQLAREILLAKPIASLLVHLKTSLGTLLPAGSELSEMLGITMGGRGTLGILQKAGPWAAAKYYFGSNPLAALVIIPELVVLLIQYLGCALFALDGIRNSGRFERDKATWLILLTILAFLLIAGPGSVARYRMPVDPLLSVTAGSVLAISSLKHQSA